MTNFKIKDPNIRKKWEETGKMLHDTVRPTFVKTKHVNEMSLKELKEAERLFLLWYPKETNEELKEKKKYIYDHYIKQRIAELSEDTRVQEDALELFT